MTTALDVLNLGLGKIASDRIGSITPPRTTLEIHCASGYPKWVDQELAKNVWLFAREIVPLTQDGDKIAGLDKPYRFQLPNNSVKQLRNPGDKWERRGRYLFSDQPTLTLDHIQRTPEADFDPLFLEVLANRVAKECVKRITEATTDEGSIATWYREAYKDAAKNNAVIILQVEEDPEQESAYTWINDRFL